MRALHAKLQQADAWGHVRTVEVAWMPMDVTDAYKYKKDTVWAFEDASEPPIMMRRSAANGSAEWETVKQRHIDLHHIVAELSEVASINELTEGTFCIVSDSDDSEE